MSSSRTKGLLYKEMFTGFHFLLLQPKTGTLADTLKEEHIIIILVIFCLILSGMCFTFVFNCVRKLIRDHRIIQVSITRGLVAPNWFTVTRSFKALRHGEKSAVTNTVVKIRDTKKKKALVPFQRSLETGNDASFSRSILLVPRVFLTLR